VNPIAFRLYRPPEAEDQPADLIDEMDRVGIDRAAVYHIAARTEDAKAYNDQLIEDISNYPRLEPSWVIRPEALDGYGGASGFVDEMTSAGVGVVRMFPGEWDWMHPDEEDWSLTDDDMKPVFEELKEANAVVVLDALSGTLSGGFGFSDLEQVCNTYAASSSDEPGLSVILTQHFPPVDIPDGPMIETVQNADNLYIDTTRFQAFQGPRNFVDLVGDDRLLYGTHSPHSSPGATLATVMQSQLTDEEKRKVMWDNFEDLIVDSPSDLGDGRGRGSGKGNGKGRGNGNGRDDEGDEQIAPGRSAGKGSKYGAEETQFQTVPYGIVDLHGHISGNGDALVEEMDRSGIDVSCVSNLWGSPDGNDVAAAAGERHPDRLVPMAYADPTHWDSDSALRGEMKRCFDEHGMRMIKIHPANADLTGGDAAYDPVYEFANEREALVATHAYGTEEDAEMWKEVAAAYPDMTLMLYHAARRWPSAENFAAVPQAHDNVLLEITYSYVIDGIVEELIELTSPETVFFGTDIPRSPQSQVGWATYERLDPAVRHKHMRTNGLELLDDLGALPDAYEDEV
jgi:predicted TIM-barrel fold metal-dependent hydrolase